MGRLQRTDTSLPSVDLAVAVEGSSGGASTTAFGARGVLPSPGDLGGPAPAARPGGLCDTKEGPLAIAAGLSFDAADNQRFGLVAGERFAHVRSGDQDGCRLNNGFRSRKDVKTRG
jgi:hypothetical protein